MQILPHPDAACDCPPPKESLPSAPLAWVLRGCGVVFVVATTGLSFRYLTILDDYTQNDYLWTHFNASGTQRFVSDVFNAKLWHISTDIPLFTADVALARDYSTSQTWVTVQATDARRIAMEQLNSVPLAVASLRKQTPFQTLRSITCYCWLDFQQAWEVAHTAARQDRCRAKYAPNGVVYMEAMLRNTEWAPWTQMWGKLFDTAYGSAVQESAGGRTWLNQTKDAFVTHSIGDEVIFWAHFNITQYIIPWHNRHASGFDNSITLRNALQTFSLPLHRVEYQRRAGLWTSVIASFGVYNDLNYASDFGASLVRNASNSFVLLPESSSPEMWTGGYPSTPWSILLHDRIGPLSSIDLMYVLPPRALLTVHQAAQTSLSRELQSNAHLRAMFHEVRTDGFRLAIAPFKWTSTPGVEFFGGNPLCIDGKSTPYVQDAFGFDDACTDPHSPLTLEITSQNVLLAMFLSNLSTPNPPSLCSILLPEDDTCDGWFLQHSRLYDAWSHTAAFPALSMDVASLHADVAALNIGFMQYVRRNNTFDILQQLLLAPDDPVWKFLGWMVILDWVDGAREVVSFEGDAQTLVLMSKAYAPDTFVLDPLQVPSRFTFIIGVVMWYMTAFTTCVLLLALGYGVAARGSLVGTNLFFASPVVGIIWIGRPLLIIRGITAMIILSSAHLRLEATDGFTHLVAHQRSLLDAVIVSGETLWLTYAVNDVLSVVTRHKSSLCTVLSSAMVWTISVAIELVAPIEPTASFDRVCSCPNMDAQVNCVSGAVDVGHFQRFALLCIVQATCIVVTNVAAGVRARYVATSSDPNTPVVIPAIAMHLFQKDRHLVRFDSVASVLCGIIPVHFLKATFNVVLWMLLPDDTATSVEVFRSPICRLASTVSACPTVSDIRTTRSRFQMRASVACAFLVSSAASSALFFFVSQSKLSNDFLWEGFNSTGMQPFLMDLFNTELSLRPRPDQTIDIQDASIAQLYNGTVATVLVSALYPYIVQFEHLSLLTIVKGLRQMDGADVPWIATQYCWVDLNRRWEMANSKRRQQRCASSMAHNGAVYLATMMRNVDWPRFCEFWGNTVETAILQDLRQSTAGQAWVSETLDRSIVRPPEDEVALWLQHNVSAFVVQWQNYKTLAMSESIQIETSRGFDHQLTLKSMAGGYRFDFQTSMKMYWGWANDLRAVYHQNDTTGAPVSLVRESAAFAFRNQSAESRLVENGFVTSPIDEGLALVQSLVGPFGSIDIMHVPCPQQLIELYKAFVHEATQAMLANPASQAGAGGSVQTIRPVPTAWKTGYRLSRGGNILCPPVPSAADISIDILIWFSHVSACGGVFAEVIYTSRVHTAIALVAWGALRQCADRTAPCEVRSVEEACKASTNSAAECVDVFAPVVTWLQAHVSNASLVRLYDQAKAVQTVLEATKIEIVQYAQQNATAPIELLHMNLFSSRDPLFQLFGWFFVLDWVKGIREVITLDGDAGALTIMSTSTQLTSSTPNPLEVPTNLAHYCQLCIQYTTLVSFVVSFGTLVYALSNHRCVEGLNMVEINRVGGIIWVGRPLLFLRSLVATLLLSTSTLTLEKAGVFTRLLTPLASPYQTLSMVLASSEMCWLVIVITDLLMVVTRDHTSLYSLHSSILVTTGTIIFSIAKPVEPVISLNRVCQAVSVDFQLECSAGVVHVGSLARTRQLVELTVAVIVVCFIADKWRRPSFKLPQHALSLLLPAGAYYLFVKGPWIFHNVLYLDKASAFMCGLIAITRGRVVYLLDIKTWRTHVISIDGEFDPRVLSCLKHDQERILAAVPMVE